AFLACGQGNYQDKIELTKDGENLGVSGAGSRRLSPGSQLLLPGKRVRSDGIEILEPRSPMECRTDAIHIRHERGWITRTPRRHLDRKVPSACPPHSVDNLKY